MFLGESAISFFFTKSDNKFRKNFIFIERLLYGYIVRQ